MMLQRDLPFTRAGLVGHGLSVTTGPSVRSVARFASLLDHFEAITGGQRLITRKDVRPEHLKAFLPDFFIFDFDVDEDGVVSDVRSRLQGTRVSSIYGELTGRSVKDYPDTVVRDRCFRSCQCAYEKSIPFAYSLQSVQDGQLYRLSILCIPMADAHGNVRQVCGMIDFSTDLSDASADLPGQQPN